MHKSAPKKKVPLGDQKSIRRFGSWVVRQDTQFLSLSGSRLLKRKTSLNFTDPKLPKRKHIWISLTYIKNQKFRTHSVRISLKVLVMGWLYSLLKILSHLRGWFLESIAYLQGYGTSCKPLKFLVFIGDAFNVRDGPSHCKLSGNFICWRWNVFIKILLDIPQWSCYTSFVDTWRFFSNHGGACIALVLNKIENWGIKNKW